MASLKCYELIQCSHQRLGNNCRLCGVFLTESVEAYKTERYRNSQPSTLRYLKSLRRAQRCPLQDTFPDPERLYLYLQRLIEKFQFGMEILSLGILLFNFLYQKFPSNQRAYESQMEFYSSVAVVIAAKAIELDKRIPYYSRVQRHADSSRAKEDYQKAETEMLGQLEFQVQIPTFVTFLNYYLSNGLLFSNDALDKKNVFIIEEKVKEFTFGALRTGDFLKKSQEKLAAQIVLKARKSCHLPWNPMTDKYSLLQAPYFEEVTALRILTTSTNIITTTISSLTSNHQTSMPKANRIFANKKYNHSRLVNSSLGFMSVRNQNL